MLADVQVLVRALKCALAVGFECGPHCRPIVRSVSRPPPSDNPLLLRVQFRRCKSSNDRPGSAPRQPLHLSQQNIGSQDDTGPLFAPRRPSQPFPGSQRPGSSRSSSRRQWRPTSSNGEIPEVPPEEAEALDRRNAMRPSPNQRPQSAMAAPSLGVIGRCEALASPSKLQEIVLCVQHPSFRLVFATVPAAPGS